MQQKRGVLSVVVPCYNEEEVLEESHARILSALSKIDLDLEIVYVDDGSSDKTNEILRRLAAADDRVRAVCLSRNFGHQLAVSAGIDHAAGDAVVVMDADLQDPPELIPDMLAQWRSGSEVVYGRRMERLGEPLFKRVATKLFYKMLNRFSEIEMPLDSGDFRLLDRKVVDVLRQMPERDRFVRGMVSWIGFRQTEVRYTRAARLRGKSHYPLSKLIGLAAAGFMSFAPLPTKFITWLGAIVALLSLAGLVGLVAVGLAAHGAVNLVPLLLLALLFVGGVQLVFLGVIGCYIGRTYMETKRRPLYVVAELIGGPTPR